MLLLMDSFLAIKNNATSVNILNAHKHAFLHGKDLGMEVVHM